MVFSAAGTPPHEEVPLTAGEHLLDLDNLDLADRVELTELVSFPVVVKEEDVPDGERAVRR